jgi:hypothetical protein
LQNDADGLDGGAHTAADLVGSLVASAATSDHTEAGDLCASIRDLTGGGRPLLRVL